MQVSVRKDSYYRAVEALENKEFFKLTLGASFSNSRQIERLSFIYSLAGAHVIDVMASPKLVKAVREGIDNALRWSRDHGHEVSIPLMMISIKSDEDPHFQKAWIANKGKVHIPQALIQVCPTKALQRDGIMVDLCIGCGLCVNEEIPIILRPLKKVSRDLVVSCLNEGASGVEFHLGEGDREKFVSLLNEIRSSLNDEILLSFTVGSHQMSPLRVQEVVRHIQSQMKNRRVVLQADGAPMSGKDGKGSTLQALAMAQVVQSVKRKDWLQASGGTNNLTRQLADTFDIELNGVAMGTYARKILDGINLERTDGIRRAVGRAKKLVESVKA